MSKSPLVLVTLAGLVVGAASLAESVAVPQDPTAGAAFVGANECKSCHFLDHRTWASTKHAQAWEKLPAQYRDPTQKDEHGRECISCHVTGWGASERGGFADATTSAHLLGVQCEACHGPGSLHVALGQQMLEEKRKTLEPGEEWHIILRTTNCSNCHNPHVSHQKYSEGG